MVQETESHPRNSQRFVVSNPLALIAEVTHRCPLHCVYCSNPMQLAGTASELSTAEWTSVFNQAGQLGMLASWPIVVADYDRLVVTRCQRDGTVYVLRPPGADPREILRVARLVLPEGSYGELADQLGIPAGLPMG